MNHFLTELLATVNAINLAITMICAFTIFFRREPPKTFQQYTIHLALLMVIGGSFGAVIAPFYWLEQPMWWSVTLKTGFAILFYRAAKATLAHSHRRIDDPPEFSRNGRIT